jgi:HEPN domain-containing protein
MRVQWREVPGQGGPAVNRLRWQRVAQARLNDAKAILAVRRWTAAYYLAGYAVECGLKSCILAKVGAAPEVLFEDRRFSEKCWTHDLVQLVDQAGLKATLEADSVADLELRGNWEVVRRWSESVRYRAKTRSEAAELYHAIAEKKHGVMTWIRRYW